MAEEFLRVLLDTNIYGLICELSDARKTVFQIAEHSTVCGSRVVRQELRNIPKKVIRGRAKLRNQALEFYDVLVAEKRNYSVTDFVRVLALEYNSMYKGSKSWSELENDFLIVATASIHSINVVVSNDERTMTSKEAVEAYYFANQKFELKTPDFIKFEEYKKMVFK
ncbi:MAG: hypothetical protein QT03_C0001G0970 [archaeon GW2011_AR10]|uniref:PIN domain-containing protein n=1 Tax=Candidatus Iainarchaeum sp. TaxID=3101447 RepID=A0A7J4ISF6_9ARCH|nr:MAG: hypothetical protein QT03_C0001G0970 [archaeon GW2011_AR10]HIH08438.1 PIN domain-containing protein [Candidatus Diapherotrites archaeon]